MTTLCTIPYRLLGLILAVVFVSAQCSQTRAEGTWVKLRNPAPQSGCTKTPCGVSDLHLLSDGTVIGKQNGDPLLLTWYRLVPDSNGSYINGTWSVIQPSICPHGEFASQLLSDGTFFVAGGEYGAVNSGLPPGSTCSPVTTGERAARTDSEIYDPVSNQWQIVTPPTTQADPTGKDGCGSGQFQEFGDMISELLPNGTVLMAPVSPPTKGATLIYEPATQQWEPGGKLQQGCDMWEASWVKLADGSILAIDSQATTSERYVGSSWVADASVPVTVFSSNAAGLDGEEGAAFLLPNGNAIFIGATHYTAVYTPGPGGSAPGSWAAGPALILPTSGPDSPTIALGAPDAPGAMMVNGKILLTLSYEPSVNPIPNNQCPSSGPNSKPCPHFFYEYDYTTNSFTQIHAPGGGWTECSTTDGSFMLALPDGGILYHPSCSSVPNTLYEYQPDGVPLALGQPQINSITANRNGTYLLTGTGLNGISEGAAFGDDAQMSTDFPLVRLAGNGKVYYARTSGWTRTRLSPHVPGSTEFELPAGLPAGTYQLQLVVNGNASTATSFVVPPPNACGGRSVLTGKLGASCGPSCGRFACSGENALICESFTNSCGGCSLVPVVSGEGPQPGEPCTCGNGTKSRYYCSVSKQLSCDCAP